MLVSLILARGKKSSALSATVAVYRPGIGGTYTRVSNTITLSKQTRSDSTLPNDTLQLGFNCDAYSLERDTVPVQEGDIFGACIFDSGKGKKELRLVSNSSDGYYMKRMSESDADCSSGVLPNTVDDLTEDGTLRVLHVSAEISKSKHHN